MDVSAALIVHRHGHETTLPLAIDSDRPHLGLITEKWGFEAPSLVMLPRAESKLLRNIQATMVSFWAVKDGSRSMRIHLISASSYASLYRVLFQTWFFNFSRGSIPWILSRATA